ncbi:MAG TPA: hypothetical protein VMT87_02260 [Vicinamibacteria bacterium]|nr:hypothetical protein [Vicinamibacteria bacterium]
MTKTLVGTAVGALALGSLVTAQALKAPSADAARQARTLEGRPADAAGPVLVNCADGYRALVRAVAVAGQQVSQVDCVADAPALPMTVDAWGRPMNYATAATPSFASYGAPAPRPAVQTQTVYRERPATTYRTATRTAPVRESSTEVRSWKKSALIIGGSAAGGAAVGAVLDGKSGATKGAVLGGVAGTVYDIATRSKNGY